MLAGKDLKSFSIRKILSMGWFGCLFLYPWQYRPLITLIWTSQSHWTLQTYFSSSFGQRLSTSPFYFFLKNVAGGARGPSWSDFDSRSVSLFWRVILSSPVHLDFENNCIVILQTQKSRQKLVRCISELVYF